MRQQNNNNRGERSSSRWSGYIWLIICALLLLGWIITHRIVVTQEETHSSENQQLKELYLQTKNLFREIAGINSSSILPTLPSYPDMIDEVNEEKWKKCSSELKTIKDELNYCKSFVEQKKNIVSTPPISSSDDKWLVIGIPTVARIHDEPYLLRTLESIAQQLPTDPDDILYSKVLIIVVNMQVNAHADRTHKVFEEAKIKYTTGEHAHLSSSFLFTELKKEEIIPDPIPNRNQHNDLGNANVPGFLVRRQTRNIVSVMRKSFNKGKYYLFSEDDMILCHQGLFAIQYLLRKANEYHPNWLAIRTSYGMNGIFMHNKDLETFSKYLLKHQARRPPDHLVVEWYAGETPEAKEYRGKRANIGFKWNLFDHLGVISTLRSQKASAMPRCYEMLVEPVVFQVEAYNPHECPHEDIWPCKNIQHKKIPLIDWSNVRG